MFIDNTTPLGVSFANGNAGTATNIFTAAGNTNGTVVRSITVGAGTLVVADTSAPSGYNDTSKRAVFWTDYVSGAQPFSFPYPFLVPAGNGLWVCAQSGASPGYSITWDAVSY